MLEGMMGMRSVGDLCNDIATVVKDGDHGFLQRLLRMAALEAYEHEVMIQPPPSIGKSNWSPLSLGIWDWDVPHRRSYIDSHCAEMFGVPAKTGARGVTVERLLTAVHADDIEDLKRRIDSALAKGGEFYAEYRVIAAGSVRWVYAKGRCTLDRSGRPERFPGAIMDVTTFRHAG
jgi:PAS domain-containing protein